MRWKFHNFFPLSFLARTFLSQRYFYNVFLQKSYGLSLPTLIKYEAARTGSGVGICVWPHWRERVHSGQTQNPTSLPVPLPRELRTRSGFDRCVGKEIEGIRDSGARMKFLYVSDFQVSERLANKANPSLLHRGHFSLLFVRAGK